VDRLAKSFESTILTDLGQNEARPNVVTDAVTLQEYTADFVPWIEAHPKNWHGIPAMADYQTLSNTTGPLGVNPSTLAISYLCQVPKRKPLVELIVAVFVADLVFLQALWMVFTFIMEYVVKRKDKTMSYCSGCTSGIEIIGDGGYKRVNDAEVRGAE
jgi:hypothetical protein